MGNALQLPIAQHLHVVVGLQLLVTPALLLQLLLLLLLLGATMCGEPARVPSPLPDNCPYGSPERAVPCTTRTDCAASVGWPCVFCTNRTTPWSAPYNGTFCTFGSVEHVCGASPPPPRHPSWRQHLMIGDSISFQMNASVTMQLAQHRIETVHVPVNAGDSSFAKQCIATWLGTVTGRWDVISFNSGIHDLTSWPGPNASRPAAMKPTRYEVPLPTYVQNLQFVARAMRTNSPRAVRTWVTTTPCPECSCCCGGPPASWVPESFRNADVIEYNAAAASTLAAEGIGRKHTIDLYAAIAERCPPPYATCSLQLPDNVHFGLEGVAFNARIVASGVQRQLEGLASIERTNLEGLDLGPQ